jgi:hypothetical protein
VPFLKVAPESAWTVNIKWSRPILYENVIRTDYAYGYGQDHWLYMILGYYGTSQRKIFYIGKVYKSYVGDRLRNPDHVRRYLKLRQAHPNHELRLSLGNVLIKQGNITNRRVDQIESLLIYTAGESELSIVNKSKLLTHKITEPYALYNSGYHHPLAKEIHHGIFIKAS